MLSRETVKTPWMFIRRPEANMLRSGVGILDSALVQRKGLGQRFTTCRQRMYLRRREAPENYLHTWCLPLPLFFAASIPKSYLFEAV